MPGERTKPNYREATSSCLDFALVGIKDLVTAGTNK